MPILKRCWTKTSLVTLMLAVTACSERSAEYERMHDLPYDQWVAYAKSLPLQKRFQLHHEIAENDGHNPPETIDEAFADQPEESYRYMVDTIRSGEDHPEYLGIIFVIQRNPEFDLCKMPDRKIIQAFLETTKGSLVREQDRPEFYRC